MTAMKQTGVDEARVLASALAKAGGFLGLSKTDLAKAVGRDRNVFQRGLEPHTKSGELALYIIRCYRSLYALLGGDEHAMKAWMQGTERYLNAIPKDMVQSIQGLVRLTEYLDAMRGKL